MSFSPDVCSALNWKQPNCNVLYLSRLCQIYSFLPLDPVFLGTICGRGSEQLIRPTAAGSGRGEKRTLSVGAAVEFAKANNLLGLFVNSDLLVSPLSRLAGFGLHFPK